MCALPSTDADFWWLALEFPTKPPYCPDGALHCTLADGQLGHDYVLRCDLEADVYAIAKILHQPRSKIAQHELRDLLVGVRMIMLTIVKEHRGGRAFLI